MGGSCVFEGGACLIFCVAAYLSSGRKKMYSDSRDENEAYVKDPVQTSRLILEVFQSTHLLL